MYDRVCTRNIILIVFKNDNVRFVVYFIMGSFPNTLSLCMYVGVILMKPISFPWFEDFLNYISTYLCEAGTSALITDLEFHTTLSLFIVRRYNCNHF